MTPTNQDQDFQQFQQIMGDAVKPIDSGKPSSDTPPIPTPSAPAPAVDEQIINLDDSPEPTPTTPPPSDFNSLLNGKFGMNEADLQTRLQEFDKYKELASADPYKSPLGKQFDQLVAQGVNPDAAVRYLTVDEQKLSDKDVLMFKMQRESPDATAEQISRFIDKKYGLGDFAPKKDDGEGNMIKDDEAEKDNFFQLKMDSQPVRKEFKSLKEELVKPHTPREAIEKQSTEQQRVAQWQPLKDKIKSEFKQILIPVGKDKDGNPLTKLKASVKDFDVDLDTIINSTPNLKADEQGIAYVKQVMEDAYILRNKAEIFHKIGQWARSQSDKDWQARISNPVLKNSNPNDFGGTQAKTKDDQHVEGWQKVLS